KQKLPHKIRTLDAKSWSYRNRCNVNSTESVSVPFSVELMFDHIMNLIIIILHRLNQTVAA
ncbi:hypothetical protein CU098_007106, partial [Rhizopus stolonifer]